MNITNDKDIFECPHCGFDLEDKINYRHRWNHTMKCTNCLTEVEVDFDFYVGSCGSECDMFNIKELSKGERGE
jgi:uncharacterized ferredoxin-like protein